MSRFRLGAWLLGAFGEDGLRWNLALGALAATTTGESGAMVQVGMILLAAVLPLALLGPWIERLGKRPWIRRTLCVLPLVAFIFVSWLGLSTAGALAGLAAWGIKDGLGFPGPSSGLRFAGFLGAGLAAALAAEIGCETIVAVLLLALASINLFGPFREDPAAGEPGFQGRALRRWWEQSDRPAVVAALSAFLLIALAAMTSLVDAKFGLLSISRGIPSRVAILCTSALVGFFGARLLTRSGRAGSWALVPRF
jgi:hypothetical protein